MHVPSEGAKLKLALVGKFKQKVTSELGSVQEEKEADNQQCRKVREELITAQATACQLTTQTATLEQELEVGACHLTVRCWGVCWLVGGVGGQRFICVCVCVGGGGGGCMCVCLGVFVYVCVCDCVCMYMHVYMCVCVCMHTHGNGEKGMSKLCIHELFIVWAVWGRGPFCFEKGEGVCA